jgi:hypothetical protein
VIAANRARQLQSRFAKGEPHPDPKTPGWQFKLEPTQILEIQVTLEGSFHEEEFLGRMNNGGRITIPKLIMNLLKEEEENLEGHVFKVMLTPP